MTDEREPRYETPDGHFNFPEGRGQVQFLYDDGKPMTPDGFDAYMERKRQDDGGDPPG